MQGSRSIEGTIDLGAVQLTYRDEGPADAPVLVLANALGTSLEIWDAVVPRLRGNFRLVRYDQRGHGRSSRPPGPYHLDDLGDDLVGLLDALEIGRASVCGESMGGLVAMWLAIRHPHRVERLVLTGTGPH